MTEPEIRLVASSDPDYDDLIAEVYLDDECLMIVSQDNGFDSMDVQLLPRRSSQHWDLKYDVLIDLLQKCRKRLWELRRVSPTDTHQP
jgi:hypothetical protein